MQYETVRADENSTTINVFSMMNEWIDYDFIVPTDMKHRALEALSKAYHAWWDDDTELTMFEELEFALKDAGIPFTSVVNEEVEVEHGRWEYLQDDEWRCSICHTIVNTDGQWMPMTDELCPKCGAKMDGAHILHNPDTKED